MPTADELLADRVARGWQPVPSDVVDGNPILGHAACLYRPQGQHRDFPSDRD